MGEPAAFCVPKGGLTGDVNVLGFMVEIRTQGDMPWGSVSILSCVILLSLPCCGPPCGCVACLHTVVCTFAVAACTHTVLVTVPVLRQHKSCELWFVSTGSLLFAACDMAQSLLCCMHKCHAPYLQPVKCQACNGHLVGAVDHALVALHRTLCGNSVVTLHVIT